MVANTTDIDNNAESPNGGAGVIKCINSTSDTYCCTDSVNFCDCDSGVGVLRFNGNPLVLTTIGVTASTASPTISTTPRSTTRVTTTADVTPLPSLRTQTDVVSSLTLTTTSSATPRSNNHSTAIGAGVGIPLGLAALGFIFTLLYRNQQRKKLKRRLQEDHNAAVDRRDLAMQDSNSFYGSIPVALELNSKNEGIGREGQFEIEGTAQVPELPARRYRR